VVEGKHMKCNIKFIITFIEGCKIVRALIQLHMISKTSKNMETVRFHSSWQVKATAFIAI
jgi:hypothetical protein